MTDEVPLLYGSEPPCVQLMNTIWADRDGMHDVLDSMSKGRDWIGRARLTISGRITRDDLRRLRTIRDALRRLAAVSVEDNRSAAVDAALPVAEALSVVNGLIETQSPWLSREPGSGFTVGWQSSAKEFDKTLALLALEGAQLLAQESTAELKACYGPGCVLYFVKDGARREWCSPGCGNRARVARHYRRQRA